MLNELTSLLPKSSERAFRREYFMRLAVVGVVLLILTVIAHALLLTPSYLYLSKEVADSEAELAALSSNSGNSEEKEVNARISALSADASYLAHLSSSPSVSAILKAVTVVPRAGITLSGISVSPPKTGADGRVVLTGTASTRESLRGYQAAFQSLPFIANADLPISSFAKEKDIPFTITLTGTLKP